MVGRTQNGITLGTYKVRISVTVIRFLQKKNKHGGIFSWGLYTNVVRQAV